MTEKQMKDLIRNIPDYPKPGILFRDITTLCKDPEGYSSLIDTIADELAAYDVDIVIGPEARGFVIGSAVAYAIGAGFVLARKPGKLPCEVSRIEYGLEYGTDCLEIHTDSVKPGMRVAIVDDLLATGGTARAATELVRSMGAEVVCAAFAIELTDLHGKDKLTCPVFTVIKY